jgi:K+-transporting ATPase ATPase C chain
MTAHIRAQLALILGTILICVILYPLFLWGAGAVLFPDKATGSLIRDETGQVRGSRLIAQAFTREEYFWPRPSAADYNAAASGGSNLAASNPKLRERVAGRLEELQKYGKEPVPADMVTTSGSGLDPHITLRNALSIYQLQRVAKARNAPAEEIEKLVRAHAFSPLASEPLVNVLELNLELDKQFPMKR